MTDRIYTGPEAEALAAKATPGPLIFDASPCGLFTEWADPDDPDDDGRGWTVAELTGPRAVYDALLFASAHDLAASVSHWHARAEEERARAEAAEAEVVRLTALLNTPEIVDFAAAVVREAAHQRERWGSAHDDGKADADWFWLLGYLAQKAMHAGDADPDKRLHHIITTAAACANWHAQRLGGCDMRPGIALPEVDLD